MRLPAFPGAFTGTRVIAATVLAAFGLLTWWWLDEQRAAAPTDVTRHPDSYFRGLDVVRHDAAGEPEMRVEAAYAEHFENEIWIHLRGLRARGLAVDAPAWQLTAERGRLTDDGTQLDTWGNVILTRGDDTPVQLRTETLSVNTDTQIAITDAQVVIAQGEGRISGQGLWVSLADDRLRLEHDVEAYYAK